MASSRPADASTGRAGRVTIVDLARETGVSVSSVSVALRGDPGVSEATRDKVLAAAARLGYRPDARARGLREHRARAIGVTFRLHQTFQAELVEQLYVAADDLGYDLVLSATTPTRPLEAAVESLHHERCDALVLISPEAPRKHLSAIATRLPAVAVGSDVRVPGIDLVRADDDHGLDLLVAHLAGLGHRRITFVDGGTASMGRTRRRGYERAMRRHGLTAGVDIVPGAPSEDAGVAAALTLLARPTRERPTAVIAHNDMAATGLLLTLRDAGIDVPGQVSVAGYDDSRLAGLTTIGLTTISQAPVELASAALRRAVARAEGADAEDRPAVVEPHLVARTSTAAPPHTPVE